MTTDYNKTDGYSPTTRKLTGHKSRKTQSPLSLKTTIPTNIHTANIIFVNILMADKHNIPKGKMHGNCRLLTEDIVCKITQRNNIRKANTCAPVLKLLNEEITSNIQKHKQNMWKEHLGAHWDHRYSTHSMEDYTWSIQWSTSNHTQQLHHLQQQNSKHTQTYCELFHQTGQHKTYKDTTLHLNT